MIRPPQERTRDDQPQRAYLDDDEYRQFKVRVAARGVTESAYIREQLSFEVEQRGAPKGTVQKKKVGRPKTKGKRPAAKTKEPLFKFVKVESGDSMFEKEKG